MNGQGNHLSRTALAIVLLVSLLPAAETGAGELHVELANDPVAGNRRPDDLYTSDFALEFREGTQTFRFGERMFTDRSRGLRFDETHLSVSRELSSHSLEGWTTSASIGILHAGRGLLGENVQNDVHRLTRSDAVSLPYAGPSRTYIAGGLELERPVVTRARTSVRATIEGQTAPGFRSWIAAGVVAERALGRDSTVSLGLGARGDNVETAWIARDIVGGASPTAHISLAWRGLELRYSWNDYGTRSPHIALGIRTPLELPKFTH